MSIKGTVANTLEGVHILVNCTDEKLARFRDRILADAPEQSLITSFKFQQVSGKIFDGFKIIESATNGIPDLLITPDFAICEDCKKELFEPENRRYLYSYITCTVCGPRFSIEKALPYDRHRTSLDTFRMCKLCEAEYEDPTDRRFYSQTNSCPDCRITQWVTDSSGQNQGFEQSDAVNYICEKIDEGSVVAIKGIGGFLLMCDASNADRVLELRIKKDRPTKPFALMYPDVDSLKQNFQIAEEELMELVSPKASIVLLRPKSNAKVHQFANQIAPGLNRFGVMLPYTPLFVQVLHKLRKPLLATSGNLKGCPITYKNEDALSSLSNFADHFLFNNREIQIPQDDSVVKFSQKYHQKIVIRRSRGYAPGFLQEAIDPGFDKKVLAMGALLKSTFTIWQSGRCHVSQFLGDTTELEAQVSYEKSIHHFRSLLQFSPEVILVDKHPAYFSTHLGRELAHNLQIESIGIQHHEAHLWAVLGENNLLNSNAKVLGVVLDGTGMGHDGAIWGGEFFLLDHRQLKRTNHFKYYPHILGDKMAREPRLSALAILHAADCEEHLDLHVFNKQELDYYGKVLDHSSLSTSSMGRIFDAVSSILGLCHINTHEGEAAMYLEKVAQDYCNKIMHFPDAFDFEMLGDGTINFCPVIKAVLKERSARHETGLIAARFHSTVVAVIERIARQEGVRKIAFSGGVMQNSLLVDMIIDRLGDHFELFFHKELSPNDECISFGQLVSYYASSQVAIQRKKVVQLKS